MPVPDIASCVSIVTGGASGIGRSLALALAQFPSAAERDGTRIVIADMRLGAAEEVAQEVRKIGARAVAIECDVTSEVHVENLAKQTLGLFGDVNLLFNVAGVSLMSKLHETSSKDIEWLFSVNVFGLCHMVRHFVPLLKRTVAEGKTAHITNFSSGFGLAMPSMGPIQPSAYAGTKHALVGLSDAMRKELEPDGIGVSVVCPGVVNTSAWNSMSFRQERFGGPREGNVASKERIEKWGQNPDETAQLILSGISRGDFFILPLSDAGQKSMRTEVEARYAELRGVFDRDP